MRGRSRRVIAFEPLPSLADVLRTRFSGKVEVCDAALSDTRATTTLRVPIVGGIPVEGCASIAPAALSHYAGFREIIVRTERLDDVYNGQVGFIKIDVEGHEIAVLEGAIGTIRRSRPRVLIEVVEYLSPGGVQRVTEFFRALDYSGHFIHRRRLLPVQTFDRSIMQNARDQPDLTAPLAKRERFANFVYNFIFLPAEEPGDTAERIAAHIAKL
jgi:FkbM family methyltransferase